MAKTLADYEGVVFTSNEGHDFIIVQYLGNKNVEIEFILSGFKRWTRISDINAGKVRDIIAYNVRQEEKLRSKEKQLDIKQKIKDKEHEEKQLDNLHKGWNKGLETLRREIEPSVYGIGYRVGVDKSIAYYYKANELWRGILRRCYSGDGKDDKYFALVTVCERWHSLKLFMDDLPNLIGFDRWANTEDMQLDKDLLSDAMVYSPTTCLFLTAEQNNKLQSRSLLMATRQRISDGLVPYISTDKLVLDHKEQTWVELINNDI